MSGHARSPQPKLAEMVLALLVGCGSSSAVAPEPVAPAPHQRPEREAVEVPPEGGMRRPPTRDEQEVLDRLIAQTEQVRELRFVDQVSVEIHDAAAISAHLTDDIEEDDIEKARLVYTTLGLLEPGIDIRALLASVLGEQVIGYYDPKLKRLVVRDDIMRALGTRTRAALDAEVVILHEMVHALQDQRLGLGDAYELERDSDPDNALRSVAEGDATLAMMAHGSQVPASMLVNAPSFDQMLEQVASMAANQDQLGAAPAILRVTLVAPYVEGLRLCAVLHRAEGWSAIDGAHRRPPASMEQVMHPQKFLRGEEPDPIPLPAFPGIEAAGWTSVDEDSLGELELSVYLGQGLPDEIDRQAAAGWSGDRLRVYQNGDDTSAIWFTSWDDEREAQQAELAAARAGGRVVRQGRAMLLTRGLPDALAGEVQAAFSAFATALPPQPPRRPSLGAP